MLKYFFFLCTWAAAQRYQIFQGDGSLGQGWPDRSRWLSFEDLWAGNLYVLNSSCSPTYGADNSPNELQAIKESLPDAAQYAGVPPSLLFVMMMQESDGCVRVRTTANGVSNPGIMQSHNGTANCIETTPCPAAQIRQMLMDGAGKDLDFGLRQALELYRNVPEPEKYYRAARMYNAGPNGVTQAHLEQGGSTRCYASDIANRLLGWTRRAENFCPFNSLGTAPQSLPKGSSTVPSPEASLGHAPNTPTNCTQSHLVTAGDTCDKVAELYNTTFGELRSLNPSLNAACTNLWIGYAYCISR